MKKIILFIACLSSLGCKECLHSVTLKMCNGELVTVVCMNSSEVEYTSLHIRNDRLALSEFICDGNRILNVCEVVVDRVMVAE